MNYITLIKDERSNNWKIGFNETDNLSEHIIYKQEMLECSNVVDVKILKVKNVYK